MTFSKREGSNDKKGSGNGQWLSRERGTASGWGSSQNLLCKWGGRRAIRTAFGGELGHGRKDAKTEGEHRKVEKPKLFQGTKTGNLVGAGVLVEKSNTCNLKINKLEKCLMLEKKNSKQSKFICQDHHCQEQYSLKGWNNIHTYSHSFLGKKNKNGKVLGVLSK